MKKVLLFILAMGFYSLAIFIKPAKKELPAPGSDPSHMPASKAIGSSTHFH